MYTNNVGLGHQDRQSDYDDVSVRVLSTSGVEEHGRNVFRGAWDICFCCVL
jgi:hypothetical protein